MGSSHKKLGWGKEKISLTGKSNTPRRGHGGGNSTQGTKKLTKCKGSKCSGGGGKNHEENRCRRKGRMAMGGET